MTVGSPETMKAWVVSQPGPIETSPLRYVEKPVPAPAPGELLVQVLACAVCRTDLHVSEGDLPVHREHVTPGHMVVGPVAALGDGVTDYVVGDRVGVAWLRHTEDRKSTRLNSSHLVISYAVFCLKKNTRTVS